MKNKGIEKRQKKTETKLVKKGEEPKKRDYKG
jgi:hypothetical protein